MLRKLLSLLLMIVALLFVVQLGIYAYRWWFPPPLDLSAIRQSSSLGINTNEVGAIDASLPFVDLFRAAAPLRENVLHLPAQDKVVYDANGWPSQLNGTQVGTTFLNEIPVGALPEGEYTVLYDGEGELAYRYDAKLVQHQAGRDTIRLSVGNNGRLDASLLIVQSNPSNYLRNIRILPSGGICQNNPLQRVSHESECGRSKYLPFVDNYASIVFNPDYLNFMKDFRAFRFMPMSGITRNPIQHWTQRPRMEQATWGGGYGSRGAPLEIMVALANRLHKDAWFNLPHAADDDYVRQFATYVRDNLDPDLTIYLEYSNEVWNPTFTHAEYTQQQGIALGLSRDAVEAGQRFYSRRAREVFGMWEQVFGGRKRLVRVLGGWDTHPDFARVVLSYDHTYQQVDAVAIAPYIAGKIQDLRQAQTVDDVFAQLNDPQASRGLADVLQHVQEHAHLAQQFGVDLLAYEAGQGLVDWDTRKLDQHPNPLFIQANRDPRMGELYRAFLDGWQQAGGELAMLFSAPRPCQWFGCWGLKEHIRQVDQDAPKFIAVSQFLAEREAWWKDTTPLKPANVLLPELKRDPHQPVNALRPVQDAHNPFVMENPIAFNQVLEGKTWDKKDFYGRWQAHWDANNLYLTVRVYDDHPVQDSPDPTDDDAVELFIDTDNQRGTQMDSKTEYHLIFRPPNSVQMGKSSAPLSTAALNSIQTQMRNEKDGYTLEAQIPWQLFGLKPKIRDIIGMEVEINDDDDGNVRDERFGWMASENQAASNPSLWASVLFSGR